MAVVLGTNAGFVTSAPSADPAGTNFQADTISLATKDTTVAGSITVTEMGWYCDGATEAADFDVGIYDHDGVDDEPLNRDEVQANNAKGTTAGWKTVTGLNWSLTGSTDYWVAVQVDDTDTQTNTNLGGDNNRVSWETLTTSLTNPWGQGAASSEMDGFAWAIYALYEAAAPAPPYTSVNIGDTWKTISGSNVMKVNVGDAWKNVTAAQVNVGDSWKAVTII